MSGPDPRLFWCWKRLVGSVLRRTSHPSTTTWPGEGSGVGRWAKAAKSLALSVPRELAAVGMLAPMKCLIAARQASVQGYIIRVGATYIHPYPTSRKSVRARVRGFDEGGNAGQDGPVYAATTELD